MASSANLFIRLRYMTSRYKLVTSYYKSMTSYYKSIISHYKSMTSYLKLGSSIAKQAAAVPSRPLRRQQSRQAWARDQLPLSSYGQPKTKIFCLSSGIVWGFWDLLVKGFMYLDSLDSNNIKLCDRFHWHRQIILKLFYNSLESYHFNLLFSIKIAKRFLLMGLWFM